MLRLVKKFNFKRVLAMFLCAITVLSVFATETTSDVEAASSNDLRKLYIQLSQKAAAVDVENIDSYTVNDFRAIALYLSNFYQPFDTALDSKDEMEENNYNVLVNALKQIGYKDDTAKVLVDAMLNASLSSAKPLYYNAADMADHVNAFDYNGFKLDHLVKQDYQEYVNTSITSPDGTTYQAVSLAYFMAFLRTTCGRLNIPLYWSRSNSDMVYCANIGDFTRNFFYVYNDVGHMGSSGNMGNAVMVTDEEAFFTLGRDEQAALCSITQQLYIDWVGNIICDFGDKRVIIVPACINECAFSLNSDPLDDHISRPNLVSSWGQWYLNSTKADKVETETGLNIVINNTESNLIAENALSPGVVSLYNLVQKVLGNEESEYDWWDSILEWYGTRGVKDKLLVDNDKGLGKGTAEEVTKFINLFGKQKNEGFGDCLYVATTLFESSKSFKPTNSIVDLLVYTGTYNPKAQTGMEDSNFVRYNVLKAGDGIAGTSAVPNFASKHSFNSYMNISSSNMRNIYITYAFAFANQGELHDCPEGDALCSEHYVGFRYNAHCFPESTDTSLVWESLNTDTEKITSFIYYLLHPTEGVRYVSTWFKTKVGGVLVSWHEDIVGSTDSNSTLGMTQYLGITGYVTSPSLGEVSWIAELIEGYNNIIVFLLIAMALILMFYILTGYMTLTRAIVGFILFGVLAFVPPIAINVVTDSVNSICDTIYSGKFDYWSYSQLDLYLGKLSTSATDTDELVAMLMTDSIRTGEAGDATTGFSGVRLKWMTPKKIMELDDVDDEIKESRLSGYFSSAFIGSMTNSISATTSTESYSDNRDATYLYRDFTDIYLHGACSYNLFTSFNYGNELISDYIVRLPSRVEAENWSSGGSNAVKVTWRGVKDIVPVHLKDLTYSSGMSYRDYVFANTDEVTGLGEYLESTSTLSAIHKGFLNNTIGMDLDEAKPNGVAWTREGGLASTYLVGYAGVPSEVHVSLKLLKEKIANGDIVIAKDNLVNSYSYETFGEESEVNGSTDIFGINVDWFNYGLSDLREEGTSEYIGSGMGVADRRLEVYKNLSGLYFSLYAESPYYYFNNVFRDYVTSTWDRYKYSNENPRLSHTELATAFLSDNQAFFYNLTDNAGSGYGELRDYMNMHDLFYYIIPLLREGNELADVFDEYFGMYVYDDMSLRIDKAGNIWYNGECASSLEELAESGVFEEMSDEQLYKFWHDINVWFILNSYVPWLDTMEDCKYAKPEEIRVMGDAYTVLNPLDPTSYFRVDEAGNVVEGRYMVFSRSEMAYYGLDLSDLTTVERKIIKIQDNVYKASIDLMNYYTLSDEVIINAFAMIQTFEFNKEFSQTSLLGESFIMYPQGYEAKAFSYDAYLRLVVSEASGDPLQVSSAPNDDLSIYRRVIKNTSLFFGIFLLINDVLAVYIIPCLKLAFLIMIFFISIALIIAASIKLELNIVSVVWKSIFAPLGSYFLVSVGFAWLISLFMSNGASGVTQTSNTISVGDPTTVIIIMIVVNVAVMIMYFKICKKCFKDLKTYVSSVFESMAAAVAGGISRIGKTLMDGPNAFKRQRALNNLSRGSMESASVRGANNTRRHSFGGLVAAGAVGAGVGAGVGAHVAANSKADEDKYAGWNKYDRNALQKAQSKEEKLKSKTDALLRKGEIASSKGNEAKADKYLAKADKIDDKMARNREYQKAIKDKGVVSATIGKAKSDLGRATSTVSNYSKKALQQGSRIKSIAGSGIQSMKDQGIKVKSNLESGSYAASAKKSLRSAGSAVREVPSFIGKKTRDVRVAVGHGGAKVGRTVRETSNSLAGVVNRGGSTISRGISATSSAIRNTGRSVVNTANSTISYTQKVARVNIDAFRKN